MTFGGRLINSKHNNSKSTTELLHSIHWFRFVVFTLQEFQVYFVKKHDTIKV